MAIAAPPTTSLAESPLAMIDDVFLSDLFATEGSDKVCYAPAYEVLLRERRERVRVLLEVGIGTMIPGAHSSMRGYAPDDYRPGASLRAWQRYFPAARIIGIDVQPDTQFREERIETFLCDSTSEASVEALRRAALEGLRCDVIIDDGSHRSEDQLRTLSNFFPLLAEGGLYFIEDIGRGTPLYEEYRLVDPVVHGADYFEVSDHHPQDGHGWKMIVIRKRHSSFHG